MSPGRMVAHTFPLPDAAWRGAVVLSRPEGGIGEEEAIYVDHILRDAPWTGTKGCQINQLNRSCSNCGCKSTFYSGVYLILFKYFKLRSFYSEINK